MCYVIACKSHSVMERPTENEGNKQEINTTSYHQNKNIQK